MKIIFSRKGFDDTTKKVDGIRIKVNGGMPSAFVRGQEMVSFPIPHRKDYYDDRGIVGYDCIRTAGMSLRERIAALKGDGFAAKFGRCHHDPDLRRGVFGQSGPPQAHLCKNVGEGDLFLFFGWFREAEWKGDALQFCRPHRDVNALFGFLQIGHGGILSAQDAAQKHANLRDHPHLTKARLKWDNTPEAEEKLRQNNTVYFAAKNLSLPRVENLPGHGIFRNSRKIGHKLILTTRNERTGKYKPRSFWDLPDFFDGQFCGNYGIRQTEGPHKDSVRISQGYGQEFIVNATDKIQEWALERIRAGMCADEI